MRIAILVEGKTERVFQPFLRSFLDGHLRGKMPKLDFVPQDGGIPTNEKLLRLSTTGCIQDWWSQEILLENN
jgi:hypothetical protein